MCISPYKHSTDTILTLCMNICEYEIFYCPFHNRWTFFCHSTIINVAKLFNSKADKQLIINNLLSIPTYHISINVAEKHIINFLSCISMQWTLYSPLIKLPIYFLRKISTQKMKEKNKTEWHFVMIQTKCLREWNFFALNKINTYIHIWLAPVVL